MLELLDRRLIFVTGKGGVGKSTVAEAIGLSAARRGQRVIIAEMAPPGSGAGIDEVQRAPSLFHIEIDAQAAMEEYLRVKAGPMGGALSNSRLFGALAMATPGLRELLGIGKIWELAQHQRRTRDGEVYDLVVVDAPATGHGVATLRAPRVFAQTARVGPIATTASSIAASLADPAFTAIVAVTLAEEMPVRETFSLAGELARDDLPLDLVVLNGALPQRFSAEDLTRIRAALETAEDQDGAEEAAARGALAAALSAGRRAEAQLPHLHRLRERFGERLLRLPFLPANGLGPAELGHLADLLTEGGS